MAAEFSVPGLPTGAPLWITLVALFVIVMLRSHGTYWLARLAAQGADVGIHRDSGRAARRVARWLDAPGTQRAMRMLRKWGAPAVTVAYVVVGLQTAILIAAGLVRMPYLRFTIASIPGAVAWAIIWGTIGFTVFWGAVRIGASNPWVLVGIGVTVVVALGSYLAVRRSRGRRVDESSAGATSGKD